MKMWSSFPGPRRPIFPLSPKALWAPSRKPSDAAWRRLREFFTSAAASPGTARTLTSSTIGLCEANGRQVASPRQCRSAVASPFAVPRVGFALFGRARCCLTLGWRRRDGRRTGPVPLAANCWRATSSSCPWTDRRGSGSPASLRISWRRGETQPPPEAGAQPPGWWCPAAAFPPWPSRRLAAPLSSLVLDRTAARALRN